MSIFNNTIKTFIKHVFYLLMSIAMLTACRKYKQINPPDIVLDDKFDASANGWTGDFADYPSNKDVSDYELNTASAALPPPLDVTKKGILMSGHNRSDDLFMFIKKKATGLKPNQVYNIKFEIFLASNAPAKSIGIGGSPGISVNLGVGVSVVEPKKIIEAASLAYRMNISKINQSVNGNDMIVIGNIANGRDDTTYQLIQRQGEFKSKTDDQGEIWIIIGTDSGYEGRTSIFYTQVKATFTASE